MQKFKVENRLNFNCYFALPGFNTLLRKITYEYR